MMRTRTPRRLLPISSEAHNGLWNKESGSMITVPGGIRVYRIAFSTLIGFGR